MALPRGYGSNCEVTLGQIKLKMSKVQGKQRCRSEQIKTEVRMGVGALYRKWKFEEKVSSFLLYLFLNIYFFVFSRPLINKQKTEVKLSHPSVLIPVLRLPVAEGEMNQWTEGGSTARSRSLKPTALLWSLLISFATLLPSPQIHSSHFQ